MIRVIEPARIAEWERAERRERLVRGVVKVGWWGVLVGVGWLVAGL